jgi:hypothetical protein
MGVEVEKRTASHVEKQKKFSNFSHAYTRIYRYELTLQNNANVSRIGEN